MTLSPPVDQLGNIPFYPPDGDPRFGHFFPASAQSSSCIILIKSIVQLLEDVNSAGYWYPQQQFPLWENAKL